MRAREYLAWIRRMCAEVERLQLEANDCADGVRASGYEPGSSGGIGDPTARSAMANDAKRAALEERMAALTDEIGEALAVIDGVGDAMGAKYAGVLEGYYIDGLTWEQMAYVTGKSERTLRIWRDVACDWIDANGRAHAVEGRGTAEL